MSRGISKYANNPEYYYDEKSKQYRKKSQRMIDKENGISKENDSNYYFDEKSKRYRKKSQRMIDKENGIENKSKHANDSNYYYDEKTKRYKKKDDRIDCYKFINIFWIDFNHPFYVYDSKNTTLYKEFKNLDEFIDNYLLIRKKPHVHYFINDGDKLAKFLIKIKILKEEKRKKKVYNVDEDKLEEYESFTKYRLSNKNPISIHSLERLIPNKAELDIKEKEDRDLLREVTLKFLEKGDFTKYTAGSISFYNLQKYINGWNTEEHIKQQKNIAYSAFEYRSIDFQYKYCKFDKDKQEDFNHPYWKYRNQLIRNAYYLGPNIIDRTFTSKGNKVIKLDHVFIYDRSSAFPYQQAYELMPYGLPKMVNCYKKEIIYRDYNGNFGFNKAEEYIKNNRKNFTCVICHINMKWKKGDLCNFRTPDDDILHLFDHLEKYTDEEFLKARIDKNFKGHAYISKEDDKYITISTFIADNDLLTIFKLYRPDSITIDFEMVYKAKLTGRAEYDENLYNEKEMYKELKNDSDNKEYKVNEILNKLLLNSITGKDGSKNDEHNEYYLPLAIFTTSGNRKDIIKFYFYFPNNFIYSDTDSIHTDIPPEEMEEALTKTNSSLEIGKGLGKLKIEANDVEAKYVGKKHYAYRDKEGNEKIVLSQGLSKEFTKAFVNFDNVDTLQLTQKELNEYNKNREYPLLVYQDVFQNFRTKDNEDDTIIVDLTLKTKMEKKKNDFKRIKSILK